MLIRSEARSEAEREFTVVNAEKNGVLAGFGAITNPGASSRTLLERACRGDRQSLERLCRLYGRLVWKVYLSKVPQQDREDVFQEVFGTLVKRIHEFQKPEHNGPAFRAWLRLIAYNKVGNYLSLHRGLTVADSVLEGIAAEGDRSVGNGEPPDADERFELVRAAFEEAATSFNPRSVEAVAGWCSAANRSLSWPRAWACRTPRSTLRSLVSSRGSGTYWKLTWASRWNRTWNVTSRWSQGMLETPRELQREPLAECPSPEVLRKFSVGDLCGSMREKIEEHLERCPICVDAARCSRSHRRRAGCDASLCTGGRADARFCGPSFDRSNRRSHCNAAK